MKTRCTSSLVTHWDCKQQIHNHRPPTTLNNNNNNNNDDDDDDDDDEHILGQEFKSETVAADINNSFI